MIWLHGIGKHTEKLFELYEKYIGEIKSSILFIVTKKENMDLFMGHEVVCVREIPDNIDSIVLSSLIYQNEMAVQLMQVNSLEKSIYLYLPGECCDILTAAQYVEHDVKK